MEQNAMPGLTNRLLAPVRQRGGRDLRARASSFFGSKAFVSGNPVRPEFFETRGRMSNRVRRQGRHGF